MFSENIAKRNVHSRTVSQTFQLRTNHGNFDLRPFCFALPTTYVRFIFPNLDASTLERADKNNPAIPSVQASATLCFPEFEKHLRTTCMMTLTSVYKDTHDTQYINRAKPDNSHLNPSLGFGTSAVKILGNEKRRRTSPQFEPAEKESIISCAVQWLIDEPIRKYMIVYLTDLTWIQFFRVIQSTSDDDIGNYFESNVFELNKEGGDILAGLLQASDEDLSYPVDVFETVMFNRSLCLYTNYIGGGSRSYVFEVEDTDVLKIFKSATYAAEEMTNVTDLLHALSKFRIRDHPELEYMHKTVCTMLQGYRLSDDGSAILMKQCRGIEASWSGTGFVNLVRYLKLLHLCGFVHNDVAPNNIIWFGETLIMVDYGSLSQSAIFHGTVAYASDEVLAELGNTSIFRVPNRLHIPQNDLCSLVKVAYHMMSVYPRELNRILYEFVDRNDFRGLKDFWCAELIGGSEFPAMKSEWDGVMESAKTLQYDMLEAYFGKFFRRHH